MDDDAIFLPLIANTICCFQLCLQCTTQAFEALIRLDPDPSYSSAILGACMGAFQQVLAGKEPPTQLASIVGVLEAGEDDKHGTEAQSEAAVRAIRQWAGQHGVAC